jgi:hypothetical protein
MWDATEFSFTEEDLAALKTFLSHYARAATYR